MVVSTFQRARPGPKKKSAIGHGSWLEVSTATRSDGSTAEARKRKLRAERSCKLRKRQGNVRAWNDAIKIFQATRRCIRAKNVGQTQKRSGQKVEWCDSPQPWETHCVPGFQRVSIRPRRRYGTRTPKKAIKSLKSKKGSLAKTRAEAGERGEGYAGSWVQEPGKETVPEK